MKSKSILAITFALVFVVAFIAPSVSAWWIFGEKTTGDAKATMGTNNVAVEKPGTTGILDSCKGKFSTIEKCGNINENIIFSSPVEFSKDVYSGNMYVNSQLKIIILH